jgi:outer membrane protein
MIAVEHKMNAHLIWPLLITTVLSFGHAYADDTTNNMTSDSARGRNLTWSEAVEIASRQNPNLRGNRESLSASEFRLKASKWGLAPSLSADLSWTRTSRIGLETGDSYSTSLGLRQSIFDAANYGAIGEAKAARRVQEAILETARAAVSRDLKIAFATALVAQRNVKLNEMIVARRQQNLELVQLRFESGRENGGALQLSEANLADSKFSLVQAQNDVLVANAQIAALLNLVDASELKLRGEVPTTPAPTTADYKTLAATAPERIQAIASEDRARAAVTTARGRILPSIALSGNLGRYGDRLLPQTEGWSVGLTLSIPLFTGAGYNYVQAARAEARAAEYSRQTTENNLVVRVRQAHVDFSEAEIRSKTTQVYVGAARTRAEVARQKYETGLTTFDEWDRIETDLINRENNALQATLGRVTAEANWQYILGKGDLP